MANKRTWFTLHGWFAVPVWILFTFICLSGSVAVFSHELTWLTNPDARAGNPETLPRRNLGKLADDIRNARPDIQLNWAARLEPYMAVPMGVTLGTGQSATLYVNPYSGKIQAINQGLTFKGFMRGLHGWLLMPWEDGYSIGYYLVSGFSILMLGSLVSGLMIYRRFWRAFTQPKLRIRRSSRIFFGDFHRLAGVWSFWFLLVISVTGSVYLIQGILWHNGHQVHENPEPLAEARVPTTDGKHPGFMDTATLVARASGVTGSFVPGRIHFPEHTLDPIEIRGRGDAPVFDDGSYRVALDPYNGEILESVTPADMTPLQWVVRLTDPLHYGTWGGLATKALWSLFGLVLASLSISGFLIWRKRVKQPARQPTRKRQRGGGDMVTTPRLRRLLYSLTGLVLLVPVCIMVAGPGGNGG